MLLTALCEVRSNAWCTSALPKYMACSIFSSNTSSCASVLRWCRSSVRLISPPRNSEIITQYCKNCSSEKVVVVDTKLVATAPNAHSVTVTYDMTSTGNCVVPGLEILVYREQHLSRFIVASYTDRGPENTELQNLPKTFILAHLICGRAPAIKGAAGRTAIKQPAFVMKLSWILAFIIILSAAFARNALLDPLAAPAAHAGHLAGAPATRIRVAYNAAERRLQECRAYLYI
nr:hypothetical protein [Samia ricini nucleopolyhedrovirus]